MYGLTRKEFNELMRLLDKADVCIKRLDLPHADCCGVDPCDCIEDCYPEALHFAGVKVIKEDE